MLRRTQFDLIEKNNGWFYKAVRRLWLLWIIGILIQAIGIKPSEFSAGGLSLTIDRPEIIQGVIYLICLLLALRVFLARTYRDFRPYLDFRRVIWESLPRKQKTLRGFPARRDALKLKWKAMIIGAPYIDFAVILVPVGFILYYNFPKVTAAVQAVLTGAV